MGEGQRKEKNFFKKHKMGIFVVVSTILMALGLSYAWLQITLLGEKELTLHAGSLSLVLDESMEGGITIESAVPVADEEGLSGEGYTFTLENKGSLLSQYTIYLDDLALAEGDVRMRDDAIKYQLIKEENEVLLQLLSSTGESPDRVLDSGTIAPGEKYTYTLKLWIDSNAGNEIMGTVFKGKLRIEAMQDMKKSQDLAIKPNDTNVTYDAATDTQKKEMFVFAHAAGEQQKGYSKDELTDYRYIGLNPNNYVIFNDEVWRIIGIFTVEDENGKKERRMKLIRDESIGIYSFDNKPSGVGSSDNEYGSSYWGDSGLKDVLNSGAYYNRINGSCPHGQHYAVTECDFSNNGLTVEAKNMIAPTKWYLGAGPYDITAQEYYERERSGVAVKEDRDISWIGEVGLIYPSDYGYASGDDSCFSTSLFHYDSYCKNVNWLYHSDYQWLITPRLNESYLSSSLFSSGRVGSEHVYDIDRTHVRPSLYLKSSVSISSGDGSSKNPYILSN